MTKPSAVQQQPEHGKAEPRSALLLLAPDAPPELRDSLRAQLERNGFEVLFTHGEDDALALLRERSFAVALLDVGLDGLERVLATPPKGLVILAPFSLFESSVSAVRRELADAVGRAALVVPPLPAPESAEAPIENLRQARLAFERAHLKRVLDRYAGDKVRAASALGLDLSSLYRKLHRSGD